MYHAMCADFYLFALFYSARLARQEDEREAELEAQAQKRKQERLKGKR